MTVSYSGNTNGATLPIYITYSKTYTLKQNSPWNTALKTYHLQTSSLKMKMTKLSQIFTTNSWTLKNTFIPKPTCSSKSNQI